MRRRARLVYRVTSAFREQATAHLKQRIAQMEAAAEALATASEENPGDTVIAGRRARAIKSRDSAAARLAQILGLAEGSEVAEGFVEIVTRVSEGDSAARLHDAEIVIKDGVVEEIRNA